MTPYYSFRRALHDRGSLFILGREFYKNKNINIKCEILYSGSHSCLLLLDPFCKTDADSMRFPEITGVLPQFCLELYAPVGNGVEPQQRIGCSSVRRPRSLPRLAWDANRSEAAPIATHVVCKVELFSTICIYIYIYIYIYKENGSWSQQIRELVSINGV